MYIHVHFSSYLVCSAPNQWSSTRGVLCVCIHMYSTCTCVHVYEMPCIVSLCGGSQRWMCLCYTVPISVVTILNLSGDHMYNAM